MNIFALSVLILLNVGIRVESCSRTVEPCPDIKSAVAVFTGTHTGTITLTASGDKVIIEGKISGFTSVAGTKHGFHIHQFGDPSNSCVAAGGHYNPTGVDHAGPDDAVRHVGDLGNLVVKADKTATIKVESTLIKLTGATSVVGRAFVLHSGVDDLGRGGAADSKTTGNAGSRVACAIIGIKSP